MDIKKLGKHLLYPPGWCLVLLSAVSAILLTAVFLQGWEETPVAYGVYVLSAYTLTVVTVFWVQVLPGKFRSLRQRIHEHPLGHRYLTDRIFRVAVSLSVSAVISLLYVGIQVLSWYFWRSWWFVVLAVYYGIMAILRLLLLGYLRKNGIGTSLLGEWKRARLCAYILLLVNLSLSGAVLMILYQNRGYDYPGMLIYVMAAYTFYSMIHAVTDMVSYRRLGSPVVSTAKAVGLSAALVSVLNLETAMLSQFGTDMPQQQQRLLIILTGAGVSVAIVVVSVNCIIKATRQIRRIRDGE